MTREGKMIVFVAVLASLLEIIDTSIVNVALPTMMGNLGATLEDISMVVTGYAIANAIILPASAWLSDRFGRRLYFLGCITIFTLTSVACGLAPNLEFLIVFRILQGLAGGALLPTSQTMIFEQFPREKAGMAGAIFGMSVMVGPALGPVMGGYLTDNFGWRSIFNINLPLGILALFLGYVAIRNTKADDERKASGISQKLDTFGLSLLIMGVGGLQYVLERGEADDWFSSKTIVLMSLMAAASLPTFVWWELRVKNPIINVRLLKESAVQNGAMLMALVGFFLYAVVFLLPVFLGRSFHYDATQIGLLFIPGSIVTICMMPLVGKMMQGGVNPKLMIAVGFIGLEVCLWMMSGFSPLSSKQDILWSLYARGFALSLLFVPINSSVLSQYSGSALGQVAGMMNLFRQIGGSVGIALVGTLLNVRSHQNYTDMSANVTALDPAAQNFMQQMQGGMGAKMLQEMGIGNAGDAALRVLNMKVQNQVFMMSFLQLVITMMFILGIVVVPLYRLKLKKGPVQIVDAH